MSALIQTIPHTALVSRRELDPRAPDRFLQLIEAGVLGWTNDPEAATPFESMREATRAAARLPAATCAFSVPRQAELPVRRDLQ